MTVKIDYKKWIHYFLIYFLIIVNQTCLYEYFMRNNMVRGFILFLFSALIFFKYRRHYDKYVIVAAALLLCTIITRLISGGIGINAWVGYVIPIVVCIYAINYDLEKFLERFVKISVFLAAIGVVFWFIQISSPDLLKTILPAKYDTLIDYRIWSDSYSYQTAYYKGYGLFFYTFRDGGDALIRNKGLFTESGVCQMLYNSALLILLYFRNRISFTKKQFKWYLFILIIAIITVQSTTGYIILAVLLCGYIFINQKNIKNIKAYILAILFIGAMGLFVDFSLRGSDSFLQVTIFDKLFTSNNQFEIQGNGIIRINTVIAGIQSMFAHPFGIGADKFVQMQYAKFSAGGGGGLFVFGAMAGIVPFLIGILLYIIPIVKANLLPIVKVLMLFMIFYTLMAQTNAFYSLMVMFPIYLIEERWNISQNNKNKNKQLYSKKGDM